LSSHFIVVPLPSSPIDSPVTSSALFPFSFAVPDGVVVVLSVMALSRSARLPSFKPGSYGSLSFVSSFSFISVMFSLLSVSFFCSGSVVSAFSVFALSSV
jgi:hypothetical protein